MTSQAASDQTRIDTLKALQKRIREATGSDAELDFEIARTFFPRTWPHKEWPLHFYINNGWRMPDFYTTYPDGLGACMGLLHAALPKHAITISIVPGEPIVVCVDPHPETIWEEHANACRAVLLAIFSALIAEIEAKETMG